MNQTAAAPTRLVPRGADPWRRLAAAIVCNALEDYIFSNGTIDRSIQNSARRFLVSSECHDICMALNIPATKLARLRKGELRRYWIKLNQQ